MNGPLPRRLTPPCKHKRSSGPRYAALDVLQGLVSFGGQLLRLQAFCPFHCYNIWNKAEVLGSKPLRNLVP